MFNHVFLIFEKWDSGSNNDYLGICFNEEEAKKLAADILINNEEITNAVVEKITATSEIFRMESPYKFDIDGNRLNDDGNRRDDEGNVMLDGGGRAIKGETGQT